MFNVRKFIVVVATLLACTSFAEAAGSLVTKPSMYPSAETLDRLQATAKENGRTVFARVDHAAATKSVGVKMLPATVLVVGNPRSGPLLFLEHPTLAIDF